MYGILVLSLLILMIILVAIGKPSREYIGLILIITLLITRTISIEEFILYVNWDVLGLIVGMSMFSILLEESGIVELVSIYILRKTTSPRNILFLLTLTAGLVSIALENVTVVLLFAPIAFNIARKLGIKPTYMIIGIALASNMAGSATMIGDPPAIIVAGHYDLSFADFIIYNGKPSMFFITLVPMIISTYIYTILSTHEEVEPRIGIIQANKNSWEKTNNIVKDKSFLAEALLFLTIKITLLSIRETIKLPLTLIAVIGVGGLITTRILLHRDTESVKKSIREGFDWKLLLFLIGVFALSGAFAKYGLANKFAEALLKISGDNIFIITGILIWLSVAFSAVIDNTPYVATMIPVIDSIAENLGVEPLRIAWALLLGATLGGGITYIGASANLVAVRLLENRGYRVTFTDFIKKSLPFNLSNLLVGWLLYIVFWIIWF
ncbi:SLC13 family permease [Staphylothermus hellenicus]|uniref:Citrate transporter n=1 Tax=Staphylothermus hellenicus (strain DSM 12710 / JCM 10830 / BK20S6-10-b1 / P8) TaxID=591019 RepID=D7DAS9_STAHD|nr:SLC13 family permease [Staphylothermus hellenicus]ADI31276.1 Citrate transporter [Staphylothermus hellenicus DSM 12710]